MFCIRTLYCDTTSTVTAGKTASVVENTTNTPTQYAHERRNTSKRETAVGGAGDSEEGSDSSGRVGTVSSE